MKMEDVKKFVTETKLHNNPNVDNGLKGAIALLGVMILLNSGPQLISVLIGVLYPVYSSIKAVENEDKSLGTEWLIYWIVFSSFSCLEIFSDFLISWLPLYWIGKSVFLVWCMAPIPSNGSNVVYYKAIVPAFQKYRTKIDEELDKGRRKVAEITEKAQNQMVENLQQQQQ